MISHEHRFIFVHIPRTGGTSIEEVLRPYAGPSDSEPGSWPERHRTWRNRYLFEGLLAHPGYFSFAFVRNPWDRFVSNWKYFRPDWDFDHAIDEVERFLALRPEPYYRLVPNNFCTRGIDIPPDLRESFEPFLADNFGYHVLPQRYHLQIELSYVGRFETLNQDWIPVCAALGIDVGLPRVNASEHRPYTEYFDHATRDRVGKLYQEDVERLGYAFGQ